MVDVRMASFGETRTKPQGPESSPIRVFLVDDHQLLLDCLSSYLENEPRVKVVGTSNSTEHALAQIVQLQPQIVVLDVELPGRSAFDLAETLRGRVSDIRVIYLTGYASDVLLSRALKPGCYGYLLKGEPVSTIRNAILRASEGEATFSPQIQQRLVLDPNSRRFSLPSESPLTALTGRQLEVLRHLANGASVKEIARLMHLSQKSVDSHKYRIMHKLGIHDRVELARFAIREGLTRP
jgi:DNA-binding NarL/FixJ family response regulator